jgi:hypothetical protein
MAGPDAFLAVRVPGLPDPDYGKAGCEIVDVPSQGFLRFQVSAYPGGETPGAEGGAGVDIIAPGECAQACLADGKGAGTPVVKDQGIGAGAGGHILSIPVSSFAIISFAVFTGSALCPQKGFAVFRYFVF